MGQPYRKLETLDDLKAAIAEHREEGRKIIRHFKRLEQEYSDWEDRLVVIEQEIDNCERQTGLTKDEIVAPKSTVDSIIEDIFN